MCVVFVTCVLSLLNVMSLLRTCCLHYVCVVFVTCAVFIFSLIDRKSDVMVDRKFFKGSIRKTIIQHRLHNPNSGVERGRNYRNDGGRGFRNIFNLRYKQVPSLRQYLFLKQRLSEPGNISCCWLQDYCLRNVNKLGRWKQYQLLNIYRTINITLQTLYSSTLKRLPLNFTDCHSKRDLDGKSFSA
jgi:hypothetical protein